MASGTVVLYTSYGIYVIIKSYINSYFSDIEAIEACIRLHHVMVM